MSNQNGFHASLSTPWGSIQNYDVLADGVVSVTTARHGGLWLSDERIKQLPEHYKPYTEKKRWAEEDEDAALVLQYFGLLSLIPEALELHVTAADIEAGRKTRMPAWYSVKQGGPIVEAYKRQTGDNPGSMLCHSYLSPKPGGFRLARIPEDAQKWMERFDAGESVEPFTFTLEPYVVYEREEFIVHTTDGKTHKNRVNGIISKRILDGDTDVWEYHSWVNSEHVIKVTHKDKVIWEQE